MRKFCKSSERNHGSTTQKIKLNAHHHLLSSSCSRACCAVYYFLQPTSRRCGRGRPSSAPRGGGATVFRFVQSCGFVVERLSAPPAQRRLRVGQPLRCLQRTQARRRYFVGRGVRGCFRKSCRSRSPLSARCRPAWSFKPPSRPSWGRS